MYYYIFESPLGQKGFERISQIKERLSVLGIAGEMAMLSAGKSVEELIGIAVAKRYSTIVAVGGVGLINQMAKEIEKYDVVFGIIPNTDNLDIANLIGTTAWREAVENLKKRLWRSVRLGIINENNCFLTPATINISENNSYQFITKKYQASSGGVGQVRITPIGQDGVDASMLKVEFTQGLANKRSIIPYLFPTKSDKQNNSHFVVDSFELITSSEEKVVVAGLEVTSTPVVCRTQEKTIRLIVGKKV